MTVVTTTRGNLRGGRRFVHRPGGEEGIECNRRAHHTKTFDSREAAAAVYTDIKDCPRCFGDGRDTGMDPGTTTDCPLCETTVNANELPRHLGKCEEGES